MIAAPLSGRLAHRGRPARPGLRERRGSQPSPPYDSPRETYTLQFVSSNWFTTTFAALSVRPFRILWFGTVSSFIAFFMSTVVQSVVAFDLVGTNTAVGTVVFGQGMSMLVLGSLGGALADRWPKRRVIVVGQLVAASVFATIAVLLWVDRLHIIHLALGSFMMGAAFAFLGPARQALVVDLVPEERRGNAMAINNVANTGSRVVGPVIAGALLGWPIAGATGAYTAMALLYILSAMSTAWLPKSIVRVDARERHVLGDITDGLGYVWRHRRLRLTLIFFVSTTLVGFPHVTVLPGLLENSLGRESSDVTLLYLASAVGALAASVTVARFADSSLAVPIYSSLGLAFGIGLLGLANSPSFDWALFAMLTIGAANGGFQALNSAVVARESEPQFIGRVMSLALLAFAGFGLMALPLGALADAIGERATLMGMGLSVVALSIAFGTALAGDDARRSRESQGSSTPR
jgi:MFS family permease